MRLSKLEIYGFKSFAKRTEIVFPQNVTGIVGPNGSGKSNISDAVRWVLGEQSAKSLRGNSMQDVIFNGTEQRKPMNYCEVTLVFDNADGKLPLSFAEISVTRRVYRSGESEYLLNGASCRLKDVVDLFRDTGVGKEGYSIVGQGRIDEILSQRSEDRRAVFEEAAGIGRFRARKDEAEQRLRRADDNLVRVMDVLDELERQLKPLEKQAAVAREYLELSDTLRELDVRLFLTRYDRLEKRSASMDEALTAIAASLEQANQHLSEVTERRDRQEEAVATVQQALSEAHDALLAKNELLHRAKERSQSASNSLQTGMDAADRLAGEADAVRTRMTLIEATMEQSESGLSEADRLKSEANRAMELARTEHESATDAAQAWEDKLTAHKNGIMERMNRMQNVRTTQARQSAMQSQMTTRREEVAGQLEAENAKESDLLAAYETATANLASEEQRYQELRAEAEAFEQRTQKLLDDILAKQKSVQEAAQSAKAIDTRLRTLKELQDGYEGYQYPVRHALTYAKQRGLRGVHDVVAMLLSVPKEFETAFDMALGGAMQNIVTETEQDAKALIDHLRQNRLGRATFLPISTVHGRTLSQRERSVLSMKGCLGVASELCAFDEQYRGIFESLLGRTVVAEDLDSGIAIMNAGGHAFRLVTLAGDVMHSGGSMTGGSIAQKVQNLLGRERELKELAAALAEKNDALTADQAALTAMEEERRGVKDKRGDAQYALHQQEIAVVRDTERQKTAKNELDEHRAAAEALREAIAQLDESLAEIDAELKRLDEQSGREELDAEDMNARTEALSAELEQARRRREQTQEALTQAMLAAQEAEHNCDRLRRDKTRLLSDGDECRKELNALADKRQKALADVEDAKRELTVADEAIALAEQAEAAARAFVEETEAKQETAQKTLKDLQNEIEADQLLVGKETDRLHRQEMNLTRVKGEMSQLSDRLWNTYELTYAGAQEARAEYMLLAHRRENGLPEEEATTSAIERVQALGLTDSAFDENAAETKAGGLRDQIRALGTVNVAAIEEFAQLSERYTTLTAQRDDLEQAKKDLQELIERLLEQMRTVFVAQFTTLQGYFAETFTRLFGGGKGEIQLSDPNDPLNCGIEIIVQPPGKKRQLLSLFSGGERALTAIAILFAMLMLKPTPFCILDEIEAALDEANIGYFADYLKEFSESTQFVVVTHRKGTMERCDALFGVAMEERGVSSMVSVSLKDYE